MDVRVAVVLTRFGIGLGVGLRLRIRLRLGIGGRLGVLRLFGLLGFLGLLGILRVGGLLLGVLLVFGGLVEGGDLVQLADEGGDGLAILVGGGVEEGGLDVTADDVVDLVRLGAGDLRGGQIARRIFDLSLEAELGEGLVEGEEVGEVVGKPERGDVGREGADVVLESAEVSRLLVEGGSLGVGVRLEDAGEAYGGLGFGLGGGEFHASHHSEDSRELVVTLLIQLVELLDESRFRDRLVHLHLLPQRRPSQRSISPAGSLSFV